MARSAALRRHAIALRTEQSGDEAFIRQLYHRSRAEEIAAVGWPVAAATAFLDDQLRLQTAHFAAHHSNAERAIIVASGPDGAVPIGRCYVDRQAPTWRLIEIGLLDEWQGRGIGAALIREIQRQAYNAGADAVMLNVLLTNQRAAALYARLGFADAASLVATHRTMIWRPSVS